MELGYATASGDSSTGADPAPDWQQNYAEIQDTALRPSDSVLQRPRSDGR
jgi:hypothetical protein